MEHLIVANEFNLRDGTGIPTLSRDNRPSLNRIRSKKTMAWTFSYNMQNIVKISLMSDPLVNSLF